MNTGWRNLIESLKNKKVLKKSQIIDAFENIDRKDFVTKEMKDMAYIDEALPIGEEQTISQPYTVAFMLDLLDPRPGDKILDIGAGSGWQTALLAKMTSTTGVDGVDTRCRRGKVYAIEIIPKLCQFGKDNIAKYNFIEKGIVEWYCQNASKGLPENAPYDKIIAAAALDEKVPQEWFNQLKTGGRLVIPISNSIWLFIKKCEKNIKKYEHPGFAFVPFKS